MILIVHPEAMWFFGATRTLLLGWYACIFLWWASTRFSARVSDGRHTSGPTAIFLLVYDIAIKSGCQLTKLLSAAAASESDDLTCHLSTTSAGTSSSTNPVLLSGVSWKRDQ